MNAFAWVLVIVLVVAAGVWLYVSQRRTKLKSRFGPEYDRTVRQAGNAYRAETALEARSRRVNKYAIRSLAPDDQRRFAQRWRDAQSRFVDDPSATVREADALVTELMTRRGYPMSEFERRAEDLSVDHASVVQHYRQAHAIAEEHAARGVSTEDLRQALVDYRALFDDLLETRAPQRRPA